MRTFSTPSRRRASPTALGGPATARFTTLRAAYGRARAARAPRPAPLWVEVPAAVASHGHGLGGTKGSRPWTPVALHRCAEAFEAASGWTPRIRTPPRQHYLGTTYEGYAPESAPCPSLSIAEVTSMTSSAPLARGFRWVRMRSPAHGPSGLRAPPSIPTFPMRRERPGNYSQQISSDPEPRTPDLAASRQS